MCDAPRIQKVAGFSELVVVSLALASPGNGLTQDFFTVAEAPQIKDLIYLCQWINSHVVSRSY